MKFRSLVSMACLVLLSGPGAQADDILLKDGREFSGKLVRADANVVEFRIQGKIESFNISDVSRITFKERELMAPSRSRTERPAEPKAEPAIGEVPVDRRSDLGAGNSSAGTQRASVTLPAGTPIIVRTTEQIDTDRNRVGESFEATLEEPVTHEGQILAPRGSRVKGRVAYAEESGRVKGQSQLILELTELVLESRTYPLQTSDHVEVGSSKGKRTAGAAAGGAAVGAIIGAIAGGGKGAAIGAAAGAGAGAGIQVLRGGQTLKVPAETVLQFQLQKPLTLDAP